MTARLRRRNFLLTAGITLLLAACSAASAPATSSLPADAATAPPQITATAPSQDASSPAPVSPTSAGAAGSVDPCSLLTQSEVDAAAGQSLGQGRRAGALQVCQWSTSDFAASVELDVGDWSAIKAKSAVTGQTLTPVPGLGDEAWSFNVAGNAAQLYVRKGSVGFQLAFSGGQDIDSLPDLGLAREKALAAAVLGRL